MPGQVPVQNSVKFAPGRGGRLMGAFQGAVAVRSSSGVRAVGLVCGTAACRAAAVVMTHVPGMTLTLLTYKLHLVAGVRSAWLPSGCEALPSLRPKRVLCAYLCPSQPDPVAVVTSPGGGYAGLLSADDSGHSHLRFRVSSRELRSRCWQGKLARCGCSAGLFAHTVPAQPGGFWLLRLTCLGRRGARGWKLGSSA